LYRYRPERGDRKKVGGGGGGRGEPREPDPHLFSGSIERQAFWVSPRKWRHSGSQELSAIFQGLKGSQAFTKLNFRGKKASGINAVFVINRRFPKVSKVFHCAAFSVSKYSFILFLSNKQSYLQHSGLTQPNVLHCTKNPFCVFPEMKLRSLVHNSYIHVSVSNLYIPRIGIPVLRHLHRQTNLGNKSLTDI
jgi:hypothetical protein